MLVTAFELYDKLVNIYTTQYDKLTKAQKRIKIQNRPENLAVDLYLDENEDDLLPILALEDDEEAK